MNNSIFWARLLGLYTVIIAIGFFFKMNEMHALMTSMANNTVTSMILGLFTLFLGLVIVVDHQVWKGWPIIVTFLGYWITIKGIALLFFSQLLTPLLAFWQGKNMIYAPIPALVIGVILLYCSFFIHHDE